MEGGGEGDSFSPSGKRYAEQMPQPPPMNQQQQTRSKRKRTVSMSTDDLPLSALGVNPLSGHILHPTGYPASADATSEANGFAPMPSPFGLTSSSSGLSASLGMSSLFGRSTEAETLLSGTMGGLGQSTTMDPLNDSLDAAYWQKFINTDGDDLERESHQASANALARSSQQDIYGLLPHHDIFSPLPPPPDYLSSTSSSSSSASSASSSSSSTPSSRPDATSSLDIRLSSASLTGSRSGDSPKSLLARIALLEQTVDGQLKSLKYLQSSLMAQHDELHQGQALGQGSPEARELLAKVQQTHEEVAGHLTRSQETLNNLNDTQILVAIDAHRLSHLLDKLDLHAQRLRIYQEELAHALTGQPYVATAALIITQQPFPCTIKQGKSIDEPVEVTLLTGSKVEIQKMGPVRAEMLSEDTAPVATKKKNNVEPPIQNGVQPMREEGVALFRNLVFPHGSRVKTVNIRFAQDLTINGRVVTVYSEPSKPFIVMTNHGQRSATEGKLLKKSRAFDRASIPWPAFANALQLHYLKETKQDAAKPLRILSHRDLEYIRHYKFGGKATISSKEYDSFWDWFGSLLYKIRNPQKHILPMWIKGLIYGLISREECDSLMQAQNALPGSFLIRFSDSCAGQFVVVYVNQLPGLAPNGQILTEVKHYLLQSEVEKRGTLPDFLRSCDKLRYVLVRQCDPETGEITLKPVPKDTILEAYYSKEHATNLPPGYDVSGL